MRFPVRSATHHVIGLTKEVPSRNVINPSELRSLVIQSILSAALANESAFSQDAPPMVPIRMDHEQRMRLSHRLSASSHHQTNLTNSVISTLSVNGGREPGEEDMWTFSEAARREIFSRTEAQTNKNLPFQSRPRENSLVWTESESAVVYDKSAVSALT